MKRQNFYKVNVVVLPFTFYFREALDFYADVMAHPLSVASLISAAVSVE